MKITIYEHPGSNTATMTVSGNVEFHNVNKFRAAFYPIIEKKVTDLTIDFGEILYIDSSALGVLAIMYKKMKEYDGTIQLINVADDVLALFRISTLDKLISIH
ncbi:MAG: hypothetical protein CVV44_23110 [Spirochaetae bacterium HGW-Spirochaetae-1]|jgi:anti-sigma B factor antagonist|nr:MAG: hypothetical protein CVV44_23110 [Spirochaetae bacterium HGW-Spirochaetae-1]